MVKIVFQESDTFQKRLLVAMAIRIINEYTDELLYRLPVFHISGRRKITLTYAGLSVMEADKIVNLILPDVGSSIIKRVYKFKSKKEEDTGPFITARPQILEGWGLDPRPQDPKEVIKIKGQFMTIEQLNRTINRYSTNAIHHNEYPIGTSRYPITERAYIRFDMFGLVREEPEEGRIREPPRRRPRRPRKPRDRTILKELRAEELRSNRGGDH